MLCLYWFHKTEINHIYYEIINNYLDILDKPLVNGLIMYVL